MKIAMMTNNYKPFVAGVPISIERLTQGLRALGHQVVVFAPTYKEQKEEEDTVRYHSFYEGIAGGVVLPNSMDLRIEKRFKEEDFDVIHVHHPMLIGKTAVYLSKKYNIPLVFTYHTRYEQYLSYLKVIAWMEKGSHYLQKELLYGIKEKAVPFYLKNFLKHCDHIFAPTAGMEDYLSTTCDVLKNQVSVLPTGLCDSSFLTNEEKADEIRKKYLPDGGDLFCSVSRMAHEKNINYLLSMLCLYKEKTKRKFKMLFIGEGPNKSDYEKRCEELGLSENVVFIGGIKNEELPSYYQACDLFLFASKTETQGIVILESMAAGTPVLALRATGVSDIVEDGINGYNLSENMDIFADRIEEVLADNFLRERLIHGAKKTALSYGEKQIAQKAATGYYLALEQHVMKKQVISDKIYGRIKTAN